MTTNRLHALAVLTVVVAVASAARADLVAYFPLDGTAGTFANTIDDIIDDPTHGVTDGVSNTTNDATWVNDPTRGSVLNSPGTNRFLAGTQDIDLALGFTWSLWVKVDPTEAANKVIIGTRNGAWHKVTVGAGVDGTGFVDFAASPSFNFADGLWHHIGYVGTDNGSGNAANVDVSLYIDGVFIDRDTSAVSLQYDGQMEIGGSTRFSEFANLMMDDVAIWNEALSEQRIQELAAGGPVIELPTLTLRVDTISGATTIVGIAEDAIDLNYYQISSAGNSLNPTGWNSLADQDFEGNGPANGSGNGWEEAGGNGTHALGEAYLLGSSEVAIDAEVSLGSAYNTAIDARDLTFLYRNQLGFIYEGVVEYVAAAIPGDTDGDGDVDDADLGTSFSNYTGPGGSGKTAAQGDTDGDGDVDDGDLGVSFSNYTGPLGPSVPEPAGVVLLGAGALFAMRRRRMGMILA